MSGRIDMSYFMSLPGAFKPAQLVVAVVVLIAVTTASCAQSVGAGGFVYFTAIVAAIGSIAGIVVVVMNLHEGSRRSMFLILFMVFSGVWAVCYFAAVWICFSAWVGHGCSFGYVLGMIVCGLAFIGFAFEWLYYFREWRTGTVSGGLAGFGAA